jgi:hypothetical protein
LYKKVDSPVTGSNLDLQGFNTLPEGLWFFQKVQKRESVRKGKSENNMIEYIKYTNKRCMNEL